MTGRSNNVFITLATVVVALMIAIGSIMKIIKIPAITKDFSKLGVVQYTQVLGIVEMIFLVLLLYRKTMKIGFILLCGYLGGAMATHLSHDEMFLQPAILLLLISLSVYLRDKTVFFPTVHHPVQ